MGLTANSSWARGGAFALTFLVLALKIAFPPGFMPGTAAVPIMLCTGHGAQFVSIDAIGHPGKAPLPAADHPCEFAGLALSSLVTEAPRATPATLYVTHAPFVAATIVVAPGRGLAAPPPPSHAPPVILA